MDLIITLFIALGAYLLGSLSSAVIASKLLKFPDPRAHGSNNPGATNVLRLAGKKAALWVLAGDTLKGAIPVLVAWMAGVGGLGASMAAVAAFLGHLFPVFFRFQGGKGVATAAGALLCLAPALAVVLALVWAAVAALTRYASLASIASAVLAFLLSFWLAQGAVFGVIILALGIILRHFGNIMRLLEGREPRIGERLDAEALVATEMPEEENSEDDEEDDEDEDSENHDASSEEQKPRD